MAFTTSPDKPVPHFDPAGDMGSFTYAVSQMPAGKAYMAAGTTCTWPQFLETWTKITGANASYKQVTEEEMINATADREAGIETAAMFSYSSDPGYDGGMNLLTADDIRKVSAECHRILSLLMKGKAGINCQLMTWEEWAKKHDWSSVLNK